MYFIFKSSSLSVVRRSLPLPGELLQSADWRHSHPYMQCSSQHVFQINPQSLVCKMKF